MKRARIMELNIAMLTKKLAGAQPEPTVPPGDTNPYLLETIIEPFRCGKTVKYGDIDFSEFELDDLRVAAGYCEKIGRTSMRLEGLVANMSLSECMVCKTRSFC